MTTHEDYIVFAQITNIQKPENYASHRIIMSHYMTEVTRNYLCNQVNTRSVA